MMSFFTMTIPTLHTLLRCWLAVSKSIAAKSFIWKLDCLAEKGPYNADDPFTVYLK